MKPTAVNVAVRAFAPTIDGQKGSRSKPGKRGIESTPKTVETARTRLPAGVTDRYVVFDCETTVDAAQRLTFGSWQVWDRMTSGAMRQLEEGLFYEDELEAFDPTGYQVLRDYCADRPEMLCMDRAGFVRRVILGYGFDMQARIVGFNRAFDLSRIAVDWSEARGDKFRGGFSFPLLVDSNGGRNKWKPSIRIKHLDSKKQLIEFSGRWVTDGAGRPVEQRLYTSFRGRFVDLHTLVFALTSAGKNLKSAGSDFGCDVIKSDVESHGTITPEYIDYCRNDVSATYSLHQKACSELARLNVDLLPEKAMSPASVAKACLSKMGVTRPLDRWPDFPKDVLGNVTSSFYGGRAECRIRWAPVPVTLVDFKSMYPAVDSLLDWWEIITAETITPVDCTDELQDLLDTITLDDCFRPETWRRFRGIGQIVPDGDIVPVRAEYKPSDPGYNIGINPFYGHDRNGFPRRFWYSIPDLVLSKLLTGKAPEVLRAVRFVPSGTLPELQSLDFAGEVRLTPDRDLFVQMIEQRLRLPKPEQKTGTGLALKITANAGSYGIYAQFERRSLPAGEASRITVYGSEDEWETTCEYPEDPGPYCFPPISSGITGSARLMLGLLECCVTEMGGSWVFCDTDSMAIVATEHGGLEPCQGGSLVDDEGRESILALTHDEVAEIRDRFEQLNPYDPALGACLLEEEASDWLCLAISTKRYALYRRDEVTGEITIHPDKFSEHGLGHVLNPMSLDEERGEAGTDWRPDDVKRKWIKWLWKWIVQKHVSGDDVPDKEWFNVPAVSQLAASSPGIMATFDRVNGRTDKDQSRRLAYQDQVKPFNFVLSAHVARNTANNTVAPRLIAPYNTDPAMWCDAGWRDYRTPDDPHLWQLATSWTWLDHIPGRWSPLDTNYDVAPSRSKHGRRHVASNTIRSTVDGFLVSVDTKFADREGKPATSRCRGLLQRRAVSVRELRHVGKEANDIDEWFYGLIGADESSNDYEPKAYRPGPTRAYMPLINRALQRRSVQDIAAAIGHAPRLVKDALAAERVNGNRAVVVDLVRLACTDAEIVSGDGRLPVDWEAQLTAYVESTAGRCEGCGEPVSRRGAKWCGDRCRKAHGREAAWLAAGVAPSGAAGELVQVAGGIEWRRHG